MGGRGWEAGGRLHFPIGLLGVVTSLESLKRHLTNTGVNIRTYLPSSGPHHPSFDLTWSAKPALEKQISQLNMLMQQCTGSV